MSTIATLDPNFATGGSSSPTEAQHLLNNFWQTTLDEIKSLKQNDFKAQELPLARIKKIMKLDEDVKMISAEAPVLFAKAAEIFISELTLRAWVHAEDNKRRTLQRNDIAMAITKYDQFDFLIDIVPREEIRPAKRNENDVVRAVVSTDQVQYYFQLAQQQQQAAVQQSQAVAQNQQIQLQSPILQQPLQILSGGTAPVSTILSQSTIDQSQGGQVLQVQTPAQQNTPPQQQTMQVFTQVVTANGEIQQIPIQLTPSQIQAIALQMQGKQPGQSIVIQTDQSVGQDDGSFGSQPLFQLPLYVQPGGQQDDGQDDGQNDT